MPLLKTIPLPSNSMMVNSLVFNGSFSTERLFSAIISYNFLYKQISFVYTVV